MGNTKKNVSGTYKKKFLVKLKVSFAVGHYKFVVTILVTVRLS